MSDCWLKGSHLMNGRKYESFRLTIAGVELPDHGRKYENKQPIEGFILSFKETTKEFVIKEGSTNHKLIRAQLGMDAKGWEGQEIVLFPVIGDWFKLTNLLAIRVWVDEKNPRPKIAAKDMGKSVVGFQVGQNNEQEHE